MKCTYCDNESVVTIKKRKLCKFHFNNYYKKRIEKVLKRVPIKNKRILIAISGGKDSVAIFHFLSKITQKYNFYLEALFIDLGINKFSEESRKVSENLCTNLGIKLNVIDLKTSFNKTIPEIAKKNKKVCSICGTIKRFLINDFAYKNNFDFVITGHNMDDETIFLNQNILSGNMQYIKKYTRFYTETLKELKLIGKIKPQFFVNENDNKIYCIVNNLLFVKESCPYSKKSSHKTLEWFIKNLNRKIDYSYNILNFFLKINKYLPEEENIEFKFCPECGYPTVNKTICKFCKIIKN